MARSTGADGDQPTDTVYALGFHAGFVCRQSGVCCQPGAANIQVEAVEREGITLALMEGRLAFPPGTSGSDDIFRDDESSAALVQSTGDVPEQDDAAAPPSFLKAPESGFCVFMDPEQGNDCQIHARLGPGMLPQVCRTYPRRSTRTEAGTMVSLALACPTAVAMLFEESGPLAVVADPPGLGHEMLLTRSLAEVPPPKLTPEMRLTRESYHQWELRCVEILSREQLGPELAMLAIASVLEQARVQQGGRPVSSPFMKTLVAAGTLRHKLSAVKARLRSGRVAALDHSLTLLGFGEHPNREVQEMQRLVQSRYGGDRAAAVERFEEDDRQFVAGRWEEFALPLRRYLASRLFDNRLAWETEGMRSTLFAVVMMLASVRVMCAARCGDEGRPLDQGVLAEAIRYTDLLLSLRHISGGVKQLSLAYFDRAELAEPEMYLAPLAL